MTQTHSNKLLTINGYYIKPSTMQLVCGVFGHAKDWTLHKIHGVNLMVREMEMSPLETGNQAIRRVEVAANFLKVEPVRVEVDESTRRMRVLFLPAECGKARQNLNEIFKPQTQVGRG